MEETAAAVDAGQYTPVRSSSADRAADHSGEAPSEVVSEASEEVPLAVVVPEDAGDCPRVEIGPFQPVTTLCRFDFKATASSDISARRLG